MFPAQTYINRRFQLKSNMKSGVLLFPGNEESSINFKDNWYPFRQDSTLLYYVGIQIPDVFFVIDIDNDREIIFGNDLTPEEKVWKGDVLSMRVIADKAGVKYVKPLKELQSYLKDHSIIHYLPPYRISTANGLSNLLDLSLNEIKNHSSIELIKAIVGQRSIKSSEEIVELDKAVNITAKMHKLAVEITRPGMTENQIAARLQAVAVAEGGNIAFPIILTKNGQYLHNHPTSAVIEEGDIILCDCGAETSLNYAGDMTRTFPAGKEFTPLQKEIYNIVLNAHNSAIKALKPGALFKDIHLFACTKLTEGLKDLGLMKGNVKEAVHRGAHTLFFPCGLGHMMGMDVHDMENLGEEYVGYTEGMKKSLEFGLKSLRLGKALLPGYVLTVEPGLYFNPFLIEEWESQKMHLDFINYNEVLKFKRFGGIRIEEDFVITENGSLLLGKPLAKSVLDIENLR